MNQTNQAPDQLDLAAVAARCDSAEDEFNTTYRAGDDVYREVVSPLLAEIKRLRAALRFYAKPEHYTVTTVDDVRVSKIIIDKGWQARAVLGVEATEQLAEKEK